MRKFFSVPASIAWTSNEQDLPVDERNARVRARNAASRARDRVVVPVAFIVGIFGGASVGAFLGLIVGAL